MKAATFWITLCLVWIVFAVHHVRAADPIDRGWQTGPASYYGKAFEGRKTACGGRFTRFAFTAAHKTLPCGSIVQVCNLANDKCVRVVITDRGPYIKGRIIDVSEVTAKFLDFKVKGLASVDLQVLYRGPEKRRQNLKPLR